MAKLQKRKFDKESRGTKIRFFAKSTSIHKEFKAGDTIDIQIMRTGSRDHYEYGKFKITEKTLDQMIENFEKNKYGQELPVDENHEPSTKALGRYKKLYKVGGDSLYATIELTAKGAELLSQGAYRYFSPEYYPEYEDEESGELIKNLLTGGAFTNRPYFKKMEPLLATESGATDQATKNSFFIFNGSGNMHELQKLLKKFTETGKVSKDDQKKAAELFAKLSEEEKTPLMHAKFTQLMQFTDESDDGDDNDGDDDGSDGGDDDSGDNDDDDDDDEEEEDDDDDDDEDDDDDDDEEEEEEEDEEEEDDDDDDDDGSQKHSEKKISIKASEHEKLKKQAQKYRQLKIQATRRKVEEKVQGLTFSEKTNKGLLLPKNKDAVVEFAMSLRTSQRKKFFSLLEAMKLSTKIFSEEGHDKSKNMTSEEELDEKTTRYMNDYNRNNPQKAAMTYDEALKIVAPTVNMQEE